MNTPRPDGTQPLVPPESLDAIADPLTRAAEAQRFLTYAEDRAHAGRTARNDAIRAARRAGVPRQQIAERLGLSLATVKQVLA